MHIIRLLKPASKGNQKEHWVKFRGNTPNNRFTKDMRVKTRTRLSVSLSDQLIQEIDRRRGLAKRSTYIEHLIRKALNNGNNEK